MWSVSNICFVGSLSRQYATRWNFLAHISQCTRSEWSIFVISRRKFVRPRWALWCDWQSTMAASVYDSIYCRSCVLHFRHLCSMFFTVSRLVLDSEVSLLERTGITIHSTFTKLSSELRTIWRWMLCSIYFVLCRLPRQRSIHCASARLGFSRLFSLQHQNGNWRYVIRCTWTTVSLWEWASSRMSATGST